MREFQKDRVLLPKTKPIDIDKNMPVDLEIGAGVGLHSIQYAKQNRDRQLISIERTKNKYRKFFNEVNRDEKIGNLYPLHADAIAWVAHYLEESSIEKVFILYPNPEPKNKNQRWIHMPFFGYLLSRLKSGGEVLLATNLKSYADEFGFYAREHWGISNAIMRKVDPSKPPRTHFEKKYLERGDVCYEILLRKDTGGI